jgi:hypothetical protein
MIWREGPRPGTLVELMELGLIRATVRNGKWSIRALAGDCVGRESFVKLYFQLYQCFPSWILFYVSRFLLVMCNVHDYFTGMESGSQRAPWKFWFFDSRVRSSKSSIESTF